MMKNNIQLWNEPAVKKMNVRNFTNYPTFGSIYLLLLCTQVRDMYFTDHS